MYEISDILNKLTGVFQKRTDNNIGKLMEILSDQLQGLKLTNEKIKVWRDIDQAEGKGLDMLGDNINQPRAGATDEVFRVLLKSKLARSLSTGDINSIIRVISIALDLDPKEIFITELWDDEPDYHFVSPTQIVKIEKEAIPASIKINNFPLEKLNAAGLSANQFYQLVKRSMSGGISLDQLTLEGTFEFGGLSLETSEIAGFGDIDGTTGGFFGSVLSSETGRELPI